MPGTWPGTLWRSQQDQVPECLNQQEFLFNLRIGHVHNSPKQLVCHSRCSGHRVNKRHIYLSASVHVLHTELGSLACTDSHKMSFILCQTTRPPPPDFRRTDTRPTWKMDFRPTGNCRTRYQSTCALKNCPAISWRPSRCLVPRVARVTTPALRFQEKMCPRQRQITRDPVLKAVSRLHW
jgi:hypothetical protein